MNKLARWFWVATAATVVATTQPAAAQALAGATLDGQRFELGARRGRVVMVVLWRSDCPVCLDKLPELRVNAQGWRHAPFDLVLINLDASPANAESYERVRRVVAPDESSIFSFWHGHIQLPEEWRGGGRLPTTLVINREGKVVERHQGRVPPETWNLVADLLP
jgi:thiol-disulfide isomerase/thioredoxin